MSVKKYFTKSCFILTSIKALKVAEFQEIDIKKLKYEIIDVLGYKYKNDCMQFKLILINWR